MIAVLAFLVAGLAAGGAPGPDHLAPASRQAVEAPPAQTESLAAMVARLALEEGVDPVLLDALVWAESAYDPKAISPKGARGLAQLMPATAAGLGVSIDDIDDPETNVRAGARYLREQIEALGSVAGGLAAYNAGPARGAEPFGAWPRETQAYVLKILRRSGASPARPVPTSAAVWKGGMASMPLPGDD